MAGFNDNSKIMVAQLKSIDKRRLLNKIGTIEDKKILEKVDRIIREHFNL
jgi:mRNA interferase MazF